MTVEMPKQGDLVEFTVRAKVGTLYSHGFYFSKADGSPGSSFVNLSLVTRLEVAKEPPTKLGSVVYVNGTGYVLVKQFTDRGWRALDWNSKPSSWLEEEELAELDWTTEEPA